MWRLEAAGGIAARLLDAQKHEGRGHSRRGEEKTPDAQLTGKGQHRKIEGNHAEYQTHRPTVQAQQQVDHENDESRGGAFHEMPAGGMKVRFTV